MTKSYKPLDCHQHDHLELACMHGYLIELQLVDGQCIRCTPLTTVTKADKTEWLRVQPVSEQQGVTPVEMLEIRLDNLSKMIVLTPKAQFSEIAFTR